MIEELILSLAEQVRIKQERIGLLRTELRQLESQVAGMKQAIKSMSGGKPAKRKKTLAVIGLPERDAC